MLGLSVFRNNLLGFLAKRLTHLICLLSANMDLFLVALVKIVQRVRRVICVLSIPAIILLKLWVMIVPKFMAVIPR